MSERKVLNKYYPPDFDPAKLPKLRQSRDRQYTVRIMAPFNMQCRTCGEYIYKGKKFNAKTENVIDESYLGLRIYRFYIKCPKCISEINFKTDPENTDYTLENGATRLFEASKAYHKQEEQEKKDKEDEEANNPMKVLENRTKDSKLEMEVIENLEELRDLNTRHATVNYADILKQKAEDDEALRLRQEEEDEDEISKYFGQVPDGSVVKRLQEEDEDDEGQEEASPSISSSIRSNKRPTDYLTEDSPSDSPNPTKKLKSWEVSVGSLSSTKSDLAGLVKVKKSTPKTSTSQNDDSPGSDGVDDKQLNNQTSSTNSKDQKPETETAVNGSSTSTNEQSDSQGQSSSTDGNKSAKDDDLPEKEAEDDVGPLDSAGIMSSIREGLGKQKGKQTTKSGGFKSGGLSLLGGYADSDSDPGSGSSDSDET